jgi:magnesium-protoporphyrin O-methyltransferase
MSCCAFDESVDEEFTRAKAQADLRRYRERGPDSTTRLLLDGLGGAGLLGGTILDIGAGIGALTFEALDRGCSRALIVDASSACLAAASGEATRRGRSGDIQLTRGDFVAVSGTIPAATVVALDRVVCCYPSYEDLLSEALRHAETAIALSYPRDRWYVRLLQRLENGARRWRNNRFTTFVHPEADMRAMIEGAGFRLVSRRGTLVWHADVYRRAG